MNKWMLVILALLIHAGITGYYTLTALPKPINPESLPPERTDAPPRLWSFKTDAIDDLVKELAGEKGKLEEEKKTVVGMQGQIAADRAEVEKMRAEVKSMREEIEQRIIEVQDNEMSNLKTLSQTYAAMAPGPAVAILKEMDENTVVKLLSLMKTPQVSLLLAEMGKSLEKPAAGEDSMAKRAARISDKLRLAKPTKKPVATAAN